MQPLLRWAMVLLYSTCGEVFFKIINGYWILLKAFPGSTEVIIWFLWFFILLMWYITWIDLRIHGNFPGKSTGVGSPSLLQRMFRTQKLNQGLLYCRWRLHQLTYQGGPVWYSTLTDLKILKNPGILAIKPTWSWCVILLMYCWLLSAYIFVEDFCL